MHKRTKTLLAGRGAMVAASALIIATQSAYGLGLGGGNSGGISAGVSVGGGSGISAGASVGGGGGISADASVGGSSGSSGGSLADADVGIGSGSTGSSSGSNSSGGSLADVDVNVGSGSTGNGSSSGGSLADVDVNIGSGSTGSGSSSGGTVADVDVNVGSGGTSTVTETPEATAKAAVARREQAERDRLAHLPRKFREVVGAPVFTKDGVYLGQVRWVGGKRGAIRAKVSLVESAGLGTKLVELGLQNRNLRKGVIRLGLVHDRLAEMIGS